MPKSNNIILLTTCSIILSISLANILCEPIMKVQVRMCARSKQPKHFAVSAWICYKRAAAWDFQQCGMCHQQSLRLSDQSLCQSLEYSRTVKLLTEHHLDFLSLTGGYTGSSKSTLVKKPYCWKSHVVAQMSIKFPYKHLKSLTIFPPFATTVVYSLICIYIHFRSHPIMNL